MDDLWGVDQPAADTGPLLALPPRLARLAQVEATGTALTEEDPYANDFPSASELPEVRTLIGAGWRPLDAAPLYCLLPAAWPRHHRTWVRDRLPKVAMGGVSDQYWGEVVARPDDEEWDEHADVAEQARAAGLPDPPGGRIWLLRSPWPRIPVSVIYEIAWSLVERSAARDEIAQMYRVAVDVLARDEGEALRACPAHTRALLDAWAGVGRVGETAGELIEWRIGPGELGDALARTGLDEPTLLAWLASLGRDLDEDTIGFIARWQASGLPGSPPPGAHRFLARDLTDVRDWLEAGFDLYAAAQLELAGLATAIRWREAGFTQRDTYELLRADPALTPAEARAFDDAGPARPGRRGWIYYGFSATQAAAWAAKGLTPSRARLWRACGKTAEDVQPGQDVPPQLVEGRRYIGFSRAPGGEITNSEWEALPDPPGTRGRRARRWAGDDHPWINTD